MFNNPGLNLCLMNGYYDEQFPEQKETRGPSYDEYDNMSKNDILWRRTNEL